MPGPRRDRALTIEGTLEPWAPDVNEPVLWTIHEDGRAGPEGVHPLLNGDLLIVYDDTGTPVWVGGVEFDFEAGLQPDPLDPTRMRQAARGHWVHGLQKDEDPELWARMFFEHRRALVKR